MTEQLVYTCPKCGKEVRMTMDGVCDACGWSRLQGRYIKRTPTILSDNTSEAWNKREGEKE